MVKTILTIGNVIGGIGLGICFYILYRLVKESYSPKSRSGK